MSDNVSEHVAKIVSEHVAKILKVEKVAMGNDGLAIVFHAMCCDDPTSEICHTCYVEGKTDDQIDGEVQAHIARAQTLHATHQNVARIMQKYSAK